MTGTTFDAAFQRVGTQLSGTASSIFYVKHERLWTIRCYTDKTYYESKCAGLDRQIDRLVYDLYGLTEDEIKIVEAEK